MVRLKGRYICFADYNLDFSKEQMALFYKMWVANISTESIAAEMKCEQVEVELLASDLYLKGEIEVRQGGMQGTEVVEDNKIRIEVMV